MRRNLQRSFAASLLVGAVLVIALNTWFAVSAVRGLQSNAFWLAHTWQVIGQVERVINSAKDAESATRGYVTSGDASYIPIYEAARSELPGQIDELRRLILDNASQRPRIVQLKALIVPRLEVLLESISVRTQRGHDAVASLDLSESGKVQIGALRVISVDIEREEWRLLDARNRDTRRSGFTALFAIGLASFFDFLLVIGIFRYFARERRLRIATEEFAEQAILARADAERSAHEVQLLNTELEERVRQRTAELETTNRELEAFSYSVSHDLRAPLRTIDGFSLALEEDYAEAVDDRGRDYIRRVRAGVQRMGGLIDALLQLSRITRADIQREDVDVTMMAEAVAKNLREENATSDLRFEIEPGMQANADPKLLQVALENLMGNAVKFSSKKEWSEIEVCFDVAQKAFLVRDNGAGFDMHYSKKLFNAFNRLHGDKDFKGSGIGLATVARVVRRHHGRIWAESEVNRGAAFWFTLG